MPPHRLECFSIKYNKQFMIHVERDKGKYTAYMKLLNSKMKIMVVLDYRYKVRQTSQQLIENTDKDQMQMKIRRTPGRNNDKIVERHHSITLSPLGIFSQATWGKLDIFGGIEVKHLLMSPYYRPKASTCKSYKPKVKHQTILQNSVWTTSHAPLCITSLGCIPIRSIDWVYGYVRVLLCTLLGALGSVNTNKRRSYENNCQMIVLICIC